MKNNVLVLGTGGREYAIVKRLKEDSIKINKNINIICIQTNINDKIKDYATVYIADVNIIDTLKNIINDDILNLKNKIIMAIVGSEDFLKKGVSDFFNNNNIPCIGPSQYCSQLETSKFFCRNFINSIKQLRNVNPDYSIFYDDIDFFKNLDSINKKYDGYVIKKDGLNRGKGVFVENIDFIRTKESISKLDLSDSILIIEEKFIGEEYSLMSLVDYNNNIIHFPPIRDYKRLKNDDKGCNTGGMGCVIDSNNSLPFLDNNDLLVSQQINETIINEMHQNNYIGVLYGSFIKTKNGVKVIEFNCRFGDPECILALNLMKNNFYEVCLDFINGSLKPLTFSKKASICVYVVPKSYCNSNSNYNKNYKYDLYFNDKYDYNITYSNIEICYEHKYSLTSRCLALTITDDTLYCCFQNIYKILQGISGNIYYRTDIGENFLSKYEASGVSIKEASKSLNEIKNSIIDTYNNNVVSDFGSFGGEYELDNHILVSSIDGVGTKTILSKKIKGIDGFIDLGKDIVSHSINDILVQGADPLFFLDYFGCNNLKINELKNFIFGASEHCKKYGNIPILGGETAEMSKVYNSECIDLIGCIIGIKNQKYFTNKIKVGDLIINLPSKGPHTNGFTLINNIVDRDTDADILEELLQPHKCYINEVNDFTNIFGYENLHGMCHNTGGGIHDNLSRVVKDLKYNLDINFEELPMWCKYLKFKGNIENNELLKVFNCGYGFLLIVDPSVKSKLNIFKHQYKIIGYIM